MKFYIPGNATVNFNDGLVDFANYHLRNQKKENTMESAHEFEVYANPPPNKLKKHERGLIISSPMNLSSGVMHFSPEKLFPDPQLLRSSLLFWDLIDWPESALIKINGIPPEIEFLISAGVIQRSEVNSGGGGFGNQIALKSHLTSYRALEKQNPGKWSMAQGENAIVFPDSEIVPGRGILFEIYDAIPVPHLSVPFQDVLNFKEKRKSELIALRHHLEDVYELIASSADPDLAKQSQFEKLDVAIKNHVRVSQESRMKLSLSGLSISIDIGDVGKGVVATSALLAQGLPITKSALGGLAAGFSLKTGVGLRSKKKSSTPYEYISKISRDLG